MTIGAGNRMDIIRTGGYRKGGIHGFHIQIAVADHRMAFITGIPLIIGMFIMTGRTAYPFMHAYRSMVIV